MIIDTIDRLGEYAACLPELKKIGKYLATNDISKLPDGKTKRRKRFLCQCQPWQSGPLG